MNLLESVRASREEEDLIVYQDRWNRSRFHQLHLKYKTQNKTNLNYHMLMINLVESSNVAPDRPPLKQYPSRQGPP